MSVNPITAVPAICIILGMAGVKVYLDKNNKNLKKQLK